MTSSEGRPAVPVGVVVGPTASGKSALAEACAVRLNAEIVSADALQVYRGLDIGTAKPDTETRSRIVYHCLDFLAPSERCTAGEYGRRARRAMRDVAGRGRFPLLVGGSGFYVEAALGQLLDLPPSDPRWRAALARLADESGADEAHRWLARLDRERAEAIDPADRQRVLRALEVVLRGGLPVAEQGGRRPGRQRWLPCFVGLRWPREVLYERIRQRTAAMFAAGWQDEVGRLLQSGVGPAAHALQGIGYRELVRVHRGETTRAAAEASIVRQTRRYAKRQLAFFKRWPVHWLDLSPGHDPDGDQVVTSALNLLLPHRRGVLPTAATDDTMAT